MSEIWTPQGSLLRTTDMFKMRWKGPGQCWGRLLERNYMCKLQTRSSGLRKNLYCLPKRKRNNWSQAQEECFFSGRWRIVGSYMVESSYASIAQRADRTNDDTKYRTLVEKLLKREAKDWPKFQEHLKKPHSVEFYQAPAQQQVANGERSNVVVQTKTPVGSITPTLTTPKSAKSPSKQALHKSTIRPPKSIKGRLKNLFPIRPE